MSVPAAVMHTDAEADWAAARWVIRMPIADGILPAAQAEVLLNAPAAVAAAFLRSCSCFLAQEEIKRADFAASF